MKNKLLIIGASGHGKVIADIALQIDKWNYIAFLDDNKALKTSMGVEIIDTSDNIYKYIDDYEIFVGIGNNSIRQKLYEKLETAGAMIPVLIHPNSTIGQQVEIGNGTAVMAGAVINCCTNIGKGCIINTGSTVDHDNIVEDFAHISPGVHLAGNVKVGKESWLGIGSLVLNNITITGGCTIGAGSVVVKDISIPGTYVGTPVRMIKNG